MRLLDINKMMKKILKWAVLPAVGLSLCIPAAGGSFALSTANPVPIYTIAPNKLIRIGISKYNVNYTSLDATVNGGVRVYRLDDGNEELQFSSSTSKNISFNRAKIHLRIGDVYPTKSAASAVLKSVLEREPKAFIGYDGGWKIYSGSYRNNQEALAARMILDSRFPEMDVLVDYSVDGVVDIVDQSGVIFTYNSVESTFGVKSCFDDPQRGSVMTFDGSKYRGYLTARNNTGYGLVMINVVNIEDYIKGVVTVEMSSRWPLEALKAQAVAARTYAISSLNKHKRFGFDLCDTPECQAYGGAGTEASNSNNAVEHTKGIVATYNNRLISAVYHSNSGGKTEDPYYVWGNKTEYLQSIDDPYSLGMPNATWKRSYTFKEVESILSQGGYRVGKLSDVKVDSVSPNGRVLSITFVGTAGSATLKKERITTVFGYSKFLSIWYNTTVTKGFASNKGTAVASIPSYVEQSKRVASATETPIGSVLSNPNDSAIPLGNFGAPATSTQTVSPFDPGSLDVSDPMNVDSYTSKIVFDGRGYGHGIGMSQYGAKKMSDSGMDYADILTYYYRGINLNTVSYK